MSVRRGHISEDKEASERREWYLQLQGKIFDSRSSEALAPINALARNLTANKCSFYHSNNNISSGQNNLIGIIYIYTFRSFPLFP